MGSLASHSRRVSGCPAFSLEILGSTKRFYLLRLDCFCIFNIFRTRLSLHGTDHVKKANLPVSRQASRRWKDQL